MLKKTKILIIIFVSLSFICFNDNFKVQAAEVEINEDHDVQIINSNNEGESIYDYSKVDRNIIETYINSYGSSEFKCSKQDYLYDFAGNIYILCDLKPIGYMIIEKNTDEMVEGSFETNSPYLNTKGTKYYLGPMNYFIQEKEDLLFSITDEQYFEFSDGLVSASSNLINSIKNHKKEKNLFPEGGLQSISSFSTESSVTSLVDANGFTVIKDHEYFRNLNTFPDNFEGTCGFVALGMLLGYLDTFDNPYTIPDLQAYGRDRTGSNILKYLLEKSSSIKIEPSSASSTQVTSWSILPGSTQALHDIFLNYGHYYWHTSDSTPIDGPDINETFLDYKNDYIPAEYADYYETIWDSFFYTHATPKALIDEGIPTIIVMTAYEYIDNHGTVISEGLFGAHDVVAYGYKDDKFLTHFGWYNGFTTSAQIIVNSATIESYCAIRYTGPHIHTDNLPWYFNGCSGYYCPCGHFECDHANHTISQKSELFHSINCSFCGSVDQEHTFSVQVVDGVEKIICDICGYEKVLNNTYDLNCRTTPALDTIFLNTEQIELYKINTECETSYDFSTTSSEQIKMVLFDSNMNILDDSPLTYLYNDIYYSFFVLIPEGTYYVMITYLNTSTLGEVNVEFGPHNSTNREEIVKGTSKDALAHMHEGHNEFFFSPSIPGFYNIELLATAGGTVTYPQGAITVTDRLGQLVQKYVLTGYDNISDSLENANNMIIYANQFVNYNIDIDYVNDDSNPLTSLTLSIKYLDTFELNEEDQFSSEDNLVSGDKLEILTVERTGQYSINISYTGNLTENLAFVLLEKNSDNSFTTQYLTNNEPLTLNLYSGNVIYIGYFNGMGNGTSSLSIERVGTPQFELFTDPNANTTCGTEVTLNGGSYGGNTITQGFTRVIYLDSLAPSLSRLDYYWYSSNANNAIISAYGTITATGAGTVTITAVYKNDLTVIGSKEIVVEAETNTSEVKLQYGMDVRISGTLAGTEVTNQLGTPIQVAIDPYVSIHTGYTRLICLGNDSPTASIQQFNWTITRKPGETGLVNVSSFGTITGVTTGEITIRGTYRYNTRFIVEIKIYVI